MISIIIPVYNVELYIRRCINSIINQTYKELQIILINDGSTDQSGVICDEYARIDRRIQVIHQEHQGASEARNAGLRVAEGDYIGFVDSDDWCEPEMFSEMLKAMQKNNADAVRCNFCIVKGDSKELSIPNIFEVSKANGRNAVLDTCYHTNCSGFGTTVWNTLFKAEIIKCPEMLLFKSDMRLGEDGDWLRRYLIRCDTVLLLPECYYNYNKENAFSITRNITYQDQLFSADITMDFLKEHDFPDTTIMDRRKQKERIQMFNEIDEYIANREASTLVIDRISVIKEVLMKEKLMLGFIKLSIVLWMIKWRLSPKLVDKIWRLHR